MKRILVTGSRDWDDVATIEDALLDAMISLGYPNRDEVILVSGNCPTGADYIAETIMEGRGYYVERHPAQWDKYGKKAGPIRNQEMVDLGADITVAFIKNNSRGASHTARISRAAGIETRIYRK